MEQAKDKVLMEFTVLWDGWGSDSKAWVLEREDGTRYLKMSNHGCEYEGSNEELNERILEYEDVLKQTRDALTLLTQNHKSANTE